MSIYSGQHHLNYLRGREGSLRGHLESICKNALVLMDRRNTLLVGHRGTLDLQLAWYFNR